MHRCSMVLQRIYNQQFHPFIVDNFASDEESDEESAQQLQQHPTQQLQQYLPQQSARLPSTIKCYQTLSPDQS